MMNEGNPTSFPDTSLRHIGMNDNIIESIIATHPVLQFSQNGNITFCNALFLDPLGFSLDDVLGTPWTMLLADSGSLGLTIGVVLQNLNDGQAQVGTFKFSGQGGIEHWVELSMSPWQADPEEMSHVFALARFVTDDKRRNADNAGQIRAIRESQAVVEFAVDGTIEWANRLFLEAIGYELCDIQGRHHSMLVGQDEADSDAYRVFWDQLREGHAQVGEVKRIGKDGRAIWIQASYTPIKDIDGVPFKVVKYATDVTDQRLVRANYSGQIEAIQRSQAVVEFSMDGKIISANENYLTAMGYSREDVLGRHHRMFIDLVDTGPLVYESFWRRLNQGQSQSGEFRQMSKTGDPVWLQAFYMPILDLTGVPFKVVKYATDITDKVSARLALENTQNELQSTIIDLGEERARIQSQVVIQIELAHELEAAKQEAIIANQTKSEFLASMSHEIRTPMTGVLGFADLLLENNLDDDSRKKVFKIKDSTRDLLRIINDILDMSKLEAGKVELEEIDFHLPSFVLDICSMFEEKRRGPRTEDLQVLVDIGGALPDAICSDPTRLRQILVNLIGNARKFTEAGRIVIHADMIETNEMGPQLRFEVEDTGIGIDPEILDYLFDKFTQADASITRRYEGTGLGLSICKQLVTLMGGEIGAESERGVGSKFWFTVPFVEATDDVQAADVSFRKILRYTARRPLHILIVDDKVLNQQIIAAVLRGFGHTCDVAENGMQGFEMHKSGMYDLICMDIRMPVLSGPDATRQIRAIHDPIKSKTPIIALTADAMKENQPGYFEAGMDAIVTKPIERFELAKAMNDVMGEEINIPIEETEQVIEMPDAAPKMDDAVIKSTVEDFLKKIGAGGD